MYKLTSYITILNYQITCIFWVTDRTVYQAKYYIWFAPQILQDNIIWYNFKRLQFSRTAKQAYNLRKRIQNRKDY